ncbi:MAG: transglutaminase domain-containing protein [Clostridia bacterium]|nr:transglutaminase domain-containing protein [Clostridia bacterium]
MRLNKKTVLLMLAVVLVLGALAVAASGQFASPAPAEDIPEPTINESSESAPEVLPEQSRGSVLDNRATLADESANESYTDGIRWSEGIWGGTALEEPDDDSDADVPSENGDADQPKVPLEIDNTIRYNAVLTVLDTDGNPVSDAEIEVFEDEYTTDGNGLAFITSEIPLIEVVVSRNGYASYYEEMDLSFQTSLTVVLEDAIGVRKLLDSAELHPYVTDNEDLNNYLDVLFAELFTPDMDTYEKVKVCYDWLIEHTYYRSPNHWDNAKNYWMCAYQVLVDGYGTCNCYSATFTAMMRKIGLECYVVTGYTTANAGGYTSHDWTTVRIGEKWYIFDPQVEDAIANRTRSKEVTYIRFCLNDPHAKYRYTVSSRAKCISRFQTYLDEHGTYLDEVEG